MAVLTIHVLTQVSAPKSAVQALRTLNEADSVERLTEPEGAIGSLSHKIPCISN